MKTIYFAGGCFWGVEKYFSLVKGVEATKVGYANGKLDNPSYIDLKKGGYIMVREGLDMIKISEATLKRSDIKIFETYDPNEPDKRKLAIAKITNKRRYTGAILHGGTGVVYYEGDQAYIAKVTLQEVHLQSRSEGDGKRHPGFRATDGDVSISFDEYCGWIEKLYGDYRIESGS